MKSKAKNGYLIREDNAYRIGTREAFTEWLTAQKLTREEFKQITAFDFDAIQGEWFTFNGQVLMLIFNIFA